MEIDREVKLIIQGHEVREKQSLDWNLDLSKSKDFRLSHFAGKRHVTLIKHFYILPNIKV